MAISRVASSATPGIGMFLGVGTSGQTAIYYQVAGLTDIHLRDVSGEQADKTELTSPIHATTGQVFREYLATVSNAGEIQVEGHLLPLTQMAATAVGSPYTMLNVQKAWCITWTDAGASTWKCEGFLSSIEAGASVDDALAVSMTIKLTGVPAWS